MYSMRGIRCDDRTKILLGGQPGGAGSSAASVILPYSVRWMGLTTRVGAGWVEIGQNFPQEHGVFIEHRLCRFLTLDDR